MNFTRNDIEALAVTEGCTEIALISMLQAGAVAAGNDEALDALCAVKAEILGL